METKRAIDGGVAAAELALKVHVLMCDPATATNLREKTVFAEIRSEISLTEAPEDAVCGLVIDLLRYCERESIDWNDDVMSRVAALLPAGQ